MQPPSDEDNEQSDKDSWHSEELKSPISTDDEDDEKVVFPIFNPNSTFGQVHLELGMEFENLDLFKDALRDYTIHLGREFVWKKNDRERVRAKCKEQECKWEIFCSWNKGEKCFQVKAFNSEHSFARLTPAVEPASTIEPAPIVEPAPALETVSQLLFIHH